MDREAVHQFAEDFLKLYFTDYPIEPPFPMHEEMGARCEALGFAMDCGQSFMKTYSRKAFFEFRSFARCVNTIYDIGLLGSAIFSKWRYVTRWQMPPVDGYSEEPWFHLAFLRLSALTAKTGKDMPHLFRRTAERMRLTSTVSSFCEWKDGEEVRQQLELYRDGAGKWNRYVWNKKDNNFRLKETRYFHMKRNAADEILQILTLLAQEDYVKPYMHICDAGEWRLKLWDRKGRADIFNGDFPLEPGGGNLHLSDRIREALCLPHMWVFDGETGDNDMTYVRMEFMPRRDDCPPFFIRHPKEGMETLVIDRKTDTLIYGKMQENGKEQRLTIHGGAENLLAWWDDAAIFTEDAPDARPPERPPILGSSLRNVGRYKLTVKFRHAPTRIMEGDFHNDGLPEAWAEFAEEVLNFCKNSAGGSLLNPVLYNWRPRRKGEYIYCRVEFMNGGKTYCYRTEDKSIRAGSRVIVPVGPENEPKTARVVSVDYVLPKNAPYPPSRTKVILGRAE